MNKALIVAPSWIGDTIMAQPLFARLQARHAELQLDAIQSEIVPQAGGHQDLLGNAIHVATRFTNTVSRLPVTIVFGLVVGCRTHLLRSLYHDALILKSTVPPKKYSSRFIDTWKNAASSTQCNTRCDM